jgi:hypothetical protein
MERRDPCRACDGMVWDHSRICDASPPGSRSARLPGDTSSPHLIHPHIRGNDGPETGLSLIVILTTVSPLILRLEITHGDQFLVPDGLDKARGASHERRRPM